MSEASAKVDGRRAEVLRLALVEGKSIRAISTSLKMARKTVRKALAAPPAVTAQA